MSARRKSLLSLLLIPLVVLVSLVAVGVASATRPSPHHQVNPLVPTITISMFAYHTPASVAPGARIKVVNQDSVTHTVTSDTAGKFNVSVPAHSSAFFHAPKAGGSYNFHCAIHTSMHGVLKVR